MTGDRTAPAPDARTLRELTAALGHAPRTYGPVGDLGAVPDRVVAAARSLPEHLRLPFLRLVVAAAEHRWLPWFAAEVVDGGADPRRFGRSGVLVVAAPLNELLRTPLTVLLGRLDAGAGWVAVPADRLQWERGNEFTGAAARPCPALNHRWPAPAGVSRIHLRRTAPAEADPVLRARRWLASRIAAATAAPTGLMTVDRASLSADARIAHAALIREQRMAGPAAATVPGFAGPAQWYAAADPDDVP
ncbi:hypothetical protein [Jidongwangia harbinensis]|uniref:hypothetical protein n=1 Tax=Jidongwangia harbinensis TaxID=2878561 RepID=UPI001CD9B6E3|nr:hypothetical protein [Jidongwangia harbinensis]MCA2216554.1 hypothetical protein [Jidongwangia harbinensis]